MENRHEFRITATAVLSMLAGVLLTGAWVLAAEMTNADRCVHVTLENAAAILELATDDLKRSSSEIAVSPDDLKRKIYRTPPYSCSIRSKSNFLKSITYVIYTYNESKQARLEYNTMKKGFESAARVDAVPDIGDAAFWVGDSRFQRMVCIKGDVVIDVLGPKAFELQKQILGQVLDQF